MCIVLILSVFTLSSCSTKKEIKDEKTYASEIEALDIFDSTVDNAMPQTVIYKLITDHFASPLPEGKTTKKAIFIGYYGFRAYGLENISDNPESAIMYVKSQGGLYHTFSGGVAGVNEQATSTSPSLSDGEIINKTDFEGYNFSSSAQSIYLDGVAYIPTANKGIIAYDVNSKETLWNFETGDSILFTAPYVGKGSKTVEASPVIDGDTLAFGANDGCLYALDIKTGNLIYKKQAGSAILGQSFVNGNKIYTASFDGYVICFENSK